MHIYLFCDIVEKVCELFEVCDIVEEVCELYVQFPFSDEKVATNVSIAQ